MLAKIAALAGIEALIPPGDQTPPGPTLRHVRKAPNGEVRMQPGGHFDIYVGDAFERNVAQQLDFLARYVPIGSGDVD